MGLDLVFLKALGLGFLRGSPGPWAWAGPNGGPKRVQGDPKRFGMIQNASNFDFLAAKKGFPSRQETKKVATTFGKMQNPKNHLKSFFFWFISHFQKFSNRTRVIYPSKYKNIHRK